MRSCQKMIRSLQNGAHDDVLRSLYTPSGLERARARAVHVVEAFKAHFSPEQDIGAALFSSPGRTELGGNHTDHQHGRVLCASVDLDMLACAAPNHLSVIRICSEGYPPVYVELDQLAPRGKEKNTSAALVRGVAANLAQRGFVLSGFDAYITSDVLSGSGLSSSAAYEVLVGTILNHFYCNSALDATQLAAAGQFAENVYFGKPCGLMDQMGAAVGGAVAIDFKDPAKPLVRRVDYDFSHSGHALCIVDTGSCHADLTEDYAQIPREMAAIAAHFGKEVLRDVPEADVLSSIPALRASAGDRAVLRALHFYEEDRRAEEEAQALSQGDFERFLALVNKSGLSSALRLQNIWSAAQPEQQAVSIALAVGRTLLSGTGAIRVHGGGFAGTIQAFVPDGRLEAFKAGMEAVLGTNTCHILRIRPQGGCLVLC